jgi:LysM repeat protein
MKRTLSRTGKALARGLSLLIVLAAVTMWNPTPWGGVALAQGSQEPAGETVSYTVQPGDTLYRLSVRFGTTVDVLVALNDIANPDLIRVGQVLLVPASGLPPAGATPPGPAAPVGGGGGPLAFTWRPVGLRYEADNYITTLHITASGGQPPYTYYHDGVAQAGDTFDVAWRRGRSKPGSVGLADATGTYIKEDYWLEDACDYPAGVEIVKPKEDAELKTYPRNFNIEWVNTIDPPPDGYWIEIEAWQKDGWKPFQLYYHPRGKSELFYVPDPFPGDLAGRVRMWGVYGACEARDKTPWRNFGFRVTY